MLGDMETENIKTESTNFDNLFNAIGEFLFILDLQGNILDVNTAVVDKLGYQKSELLNTSVLNVHPPEYREQAARIVTDMLQGRRESCPLPLLAKNGDHIPVETRICHSKWNGQDVLFGVSRNLSELSLSEEKFYRVFDMNDSIMIISEIDSGKIINVNKKFLKTLGFKREEIIGKSIIQINIFQDYSQKEYFATKFEHEGSVESEYVVMRKKDGTPLPTLFSLSKIKIQTHSYILISSVDVSELKDTEKKLQKNIKQQTLLADISQNLINIRPGDNKLHEAIAMFGKHLGVARAYICEYDSDRTVAKCTYEWCNDGIESFRQKLKQVPYSCIQSIKETSPSNDDVYSINASQLPDNVVSILGMGDVKSYLVVPLFCGGTPFGFIGFDECARERKWEIQEMELLRTLSGIISNAFERLNYQKQLFDRELQLKLAIENTEAGLWDYNIATDYLYVNDVWLKILGYESEDLIPHISSWRDRLHPDESADVIKRLTDHLEGKTEKYESIHRMKTKYGTWKWVMDKGKVTKRDERGAPLRAIGTFIDLDNQKKAEENLSVLNATKDKLFSIIAHDLRGPIGAMMHISDMLSDMEHFDVTTFKMFINSQKELSQNTFQLLENLLSWAIYNRNNIQYNPCKIDLNSIIEDNIVNIKFRAGQKAIAINFNNQEHHAAFADVDMVRLIIRNLLSNAVKFTSPNETITIGLKNGNDSVEICVTNPGPGISEENVEKILSETDFYSTHGTNNERGSGLGLKVCRSFIALNHGQFFIKSIPGKETTFSFTLPVADN
jgi:PAS domain S-box-containing protein